jgi:anti-sigma factor RsiW
MTRQRLACRHVRILLGAFVLGGLRGRQEAAVRTHIVRCTRCRAEYEELAEIRTVLDMITSEEAAEAGEPPIKPGSRRKSGGPGRPGRGNGR